MLERAGSSRPDSRSHHQHASLDIGEHDAVSAWWRDNYDVSGGGDPGRVGGV